MDNIATITDDLKKPGRESRPEWIAVKFFGLAILVGALLLLTILFAVVSELIGEAILPCASCRTDSGGYGASNSPSFTRSARSAMADSK